MRRDRRKSASKERGEHFVFCFVLFCFALYDIMHIGTDLIINIQRIVLHVCTSKVVGRASFSRVKTCFISETDQAC